MADEKKPLSLPTSIQKRIGSLRPPADVSVSATTTVRPKFAPTIPPQRSKSAEGSSSSSSIAGGPSSSSSSSNFAYQQNINNSIHNNNNNANNGSSSSSRPFEARDRRDRDREKRGDVKPRLMVRDQEAQGIGSVFGSHASASGLNAAGMAGAGATLSLHDKFVDEDDAIVEETTVKFDNVQHPPIAFPRAEAAASSLADSHEMYVEHIFGGDAVDDKLFLMQLPEGSIPVRVDVYSDGSAQLVMSDGTVCAVHRGTRCTFHQQIWRVELSRNGDLMDAQTMKPVVMDEDGVESVAKDADEDMEDPSVGMMGSIDVCGDVRTRLVAIPDVEKMLS
jgi:hypothetical protein